MQVAILADPYLFTRIGGLQRQILSFTAALANIGVEAVVFNPAEHVIEDFTIAHLFDAESGNFRLSGFAKQAGLPLVLSTIMSPNWTYWQGFRARLVDWMSTNLCQRSISTSYAQNLWAMGDADRLVTMGQAEKQMLIRAYGQKGEKITVIPPGVERSFFLADPGLFCQRFAIDPGFVLCVGKITPNKNQISLAKALAHSNQAIVLLGPCSAPDKDYLQSLLSFENVRYLGNLAFDDPLLSSAYAAASVTVLASHSECCPLVVYESLAAGTPMVLTRNNAHDLQGIAEYVRLIDPNDPSTIQKAVEGFLSAPPERHLVSQTVEQRSWEGVAAMYVEIYKQLSPPTTGVESKNPPL